MKKSVIFVCKNNSGRSQIAEGYLKHKYGKYYDVYSAGFDPKPINPLTIDTMAEIGIDISDYNSKNLTNYIDQEFDYVISLCDENCLQVIKGKKYIHYSFKDPKTYTKPNMEKKDVFRYIRDEIKDWIEYSLIKNLRK